MSQPEQSPWPFPTGRERPIVESPPGWLMLPVLVGNDRSTPPIGIVRLQASRLPRTPDWCLSLAYTSPPVVRRDRPTVGAYQPESMSLEATSALPAPGEPTPIDLCRELRAALGMPDGAMPCSPKEAWDEAIAKVRAQGQGAAP
jgi:hypothetical protein